MDSSAYLWISVTMRISQSKNWQNSDYLVIFIAGERFYADGISHPLYTLEGGGDESKKAWFAKISGHQSSKFIHQGKEEYQCFSTVYEIE